MVEASHQPGVDVHLDEPTETLIAGFTEFGLAGLTAANYLTEHLELDETGHVSVDTLPAITPFENGTPRHHTRLYSTENLAETVLVGELFIPPQFADPFANAILEYSDEHGLKELIVLSGVPIGHAPDDHRAFYIASEDFQQARLQGDHGIPPMSGGFLEGVTAALTQRGLDTALKTCVLVTPVHPQTPDVEAALRLLEALNAVYALDLNMEPLEAFAETVAQQYEELAARLEAQQQQETAHDDRMYM